MTGAALKELRESREWTQQQLAELLNESMGRNYSSSTVSSWEKEKRKLPAGVAAFLEALPTLELAGGLNGHVEPAAEGMGDGAEAPGAEAADAPGGVRDTPPGVPAGAKPPPTALVTPGGAYTRVCTELFEMVATGVGLVGAAVGSEALMHDGQIIDADKLALGRAYGRLAETNETFRKMLNGAQSSGAWLEIALVTSGTVSKCWRNHSAIVQRGKSEQPAAAAA